MQLKMLEYYNNLFIRRGLSVDDILNVDDLRKIPLLNKETLREKAELFINNNYNKKKLLCIHTTGTTGTPLKVYCNNNVLQKNYAFYTRFLNLNNIKSKGRRATFGGRIIVSPQQSKPPFWRYSYLQKNLLFSSYHISDRNIIYYIEKLKKYRPDYIDSYPSSIFAIADFAHKNNYNLEGITKGITTSAETLYEEQRDIIEDVFSVPVSDQYGAAEMCIFVGQCPKGNYHIHNERDHRQRALIGKARELRAGVATAFSQPDGKITKRFQAKLDRLAAERGFGSAKRRLSFAVHGASQAPRRRSLAAARRAQGGGVFHVIFGERAERPTEAKILRIALLVVREVDGEITEAREYLARYTARGQV